MTPRSLLAIALASGILTAANPSRAEERLSTFTLDVFSQIVFET